MNSAPSGAGILSIRRKLHGLHPRALVYLATITAVVWSIGFLHGFHRDVSPSAMLVVDGIGLGVALMIGILTLILMAANDISLVVGHSPSGESLAFASEVLQVAACVLVLAALVFRTSNLLAQASDKQLERRVGAVMTREGPGAVTSGGRIGGTGQACKPCRGLRA